ncbi:hypothetical protein [Simkania sp.]|uniref:hypothetical protein n=1 Tax=Simkania sp. TaxID=34094 RepID=UPI003B52E735
MTREVAVMHPYSVGALTAATSHALSMTAAKNYFDPQTPEAQVAVRAMGLAISTIALPYVIGKCAIHSAIRLNFETAIRTAVTSLLVKTTIFTLYSIAKFLVDQYRWETPKELKDVDNLSATQMPHVKAFFEEHSDQKEGLTLALQHALTLPLGKCSGTGSGWTKESLQAVQAQDLSFLTLKQKKELNELFLQNNVLPSNRNYVKEELPSLPDSLTKLSLEQLNWIHLIAQLSDTEVTPEVAKQFYEQGFQPAKTEWIDWELPIQADLLSKTDLLWVENDLIAHPEKWRKLRFETQIELKEKISLPYLIFPNSIEEVKALPLAELESYSQAFEENADLKNEFSLEMRRVFADQLEEKLTGVLLIVDVDHLFFDGEERVEPYYLFGRVTPKQALAVTLIVMAVAVPTFAFFYYGSQATAPMQEPTKESKNQTKDVILPSDEGDPLPKVDRCPDHNCLMIPSESKIIDHSMSPTNLIPNNSSWTPTFDENLPATETYALTIPEGSHAFSHPLRPLNITVIDRSWTEQPRNASTPVVDEKVCSVDAHALTIPEGSQLTDHSIKRIPDLKVKDLSWEANLESAEKIDDYTLQYLQQLQDKDPREVCPENNCVVFGSLSSSATVETSQSDVSPEMKSIDFPFPEVHHKPTAPVITEEFSHVDSSSETTSAERLPDLPFAGKTITTIPRSWTEPRNTSTPVVDEKVCSVDAHSLTVPEGSQVIDHTVKRTSDLTVKDLSWEATFESAEKVDHFYSSFLSAEPLNNSAAMTSSPLIDPSYNATRPALHSATPPDIEPYNFPPPADVIITNSSECAPFGILDKVTLNTETESISQPQPEFSFWPALATIGTILTLGLFHRRKEEEIQPQVQPSKIQVIGLDGRKLPPYIVSLTPSFSSKHQGLLMGNERRSSGDLRMPQPPSASPSPKRNESGLNLVHQLPSDPPPRNSGPSIKEDRQIVVVEERQNSVELANLLREAEVAAFDIQMGGERFQIAFDLNNPEVRSQFHRMIQQSQREVLAIVSTGPEAISSDMRAQVGIVGNEGNSVFNLDLSHPAIAQSIKDLVVQARQALQREEVEASQQFALRHENSSMKASHQLDLGYEGSIGSPQRGPFDSQASAVGMSPPAVSSYSNVGKPPSRPDRSPKLSSSLHLDQNVENERELENLRQEVLELYNAEPTKLCRRYPSTSSADSLYVPQIEEQRLLAISQLTAKLRQYAKNNRIDIPEVTRYGMMQQESELANCVKTLFPELQNMSLETGHGYGNSYQDKDILRVHPIERTNQVFDSGKNSLNISYTTHRKPIIQQQATRGCTAGSTAMLIYEKRQALDAKGMIMRNLGNEHDQERDLKQFGLNPVRKQCKTLESLKRFIKEHGSCIASVYTVGEHVVVVDAVLDDRVRIRDPYHGWEVDIKKEAFLASWTERNVMGISQERGHSNKPPKAPKVSKDKGESSVRGNKKNEKTTFFDPKKDRGLLSNAKELVFDLVDQKQHLRMHLKFPGPLGQLLSQSDFRPEKDSKEEQSSIENLKMKIPVGRKTAYYQLDPKKNATTAFVKELIHLASFRETVQISSENSEKDSKLREKSEVSDLDRFFADEASYSSPKNTQPAWQVEEQKKQRQAFYNAQKDKWWTHSYYYGDNGHPAKMRKYRVALEEYPRILKEAFGADLGKILNH